jgi:hypothetical protein
MKLSVNRAVINKSKDFETLAVKFVNEDLTKEQLAREINAGYAFSTQHEGRRKQDNFKAGGYIALDFDRSTPEEVEYILADPIVARFYGIFYYTFSSTPETPKFRILFELEKPIYDRELYRKIVAAFIWRFEANADESCSDPCRLFYGAKDSKPISTEKVLPMAVVNQLLESHSRYIEQENKIKEEAAAARFAQINLKSNGNGHNSSDKGKKAYIDKVLETLCNKLRTCPKGERHHTLRKYGRTMGGYIANYPHLTDEQDIKQKLINAYSVHPNLNRREMVSTLNYGIEHGKKQPLPPIPDLPDHKNIIDFNDWTGQQPTQPKIDTETGEILDERNSTTEPEKQPVKHRFHADELDQIPPVEWLLEPYLQRNCLSMLVGESEAGKTFLAIHFALTVAEYENVLYIATEDTSQYPDRVRAWREYHRPEACNFWLETMDLALMSAENTVEMIKANEDIKPTLVVIDTLHAASETADENSAHDMGTILANARLIYEHWNATVLIVHHLNKAGLAERGHSSLRAGMRMVLRLSVDGDGAKLEFNKVRAGSKPEPKFFAWKQSGNSRVPIEANETTVDKTKFSANDINLLQFLSGELERNESHSTKDLLLSISIQERTLFYCLKKLKAMGLVNQTREKGPWRITTEGITAAHKNRAKDIIDFKTGNPDALF